ncbi:MAG: hypothetical protein K2O12_06700 [Muribaculaceae bacterium]|nr:hypothetical protein [Muribaculaceae bacterium]
MKKYLTLLLGLVTFMFVFTACDDDDDLPDVDITVNFENAVQADDGTLNVVKGNPISVTSIDVTNREAGKKAIATAAIYYLDGVRIGASVVSPLAFSFPTENLPLGVYDFNIEVEILAVDKTPAFGVLGYKIKIVENATDIPGDQTPEEGVSTTNHPDLHAK